MVMILAAYIKASLISYATKNRAFAKIALLFYQMFQTHEF